MAHIIVAGHVSLATRPQEVAIIEKDTEAIPDMRFERLLIHYDTQAGFASHAVTISRRRVD
jgi:hypothetical protein